METPGTGTSERSIMVGVFDDPSKAERAVDELRQAGFGDDQIELVRSSASAAETGIPVGENIPAAEKDIRAQELGAPQGLGASQVNFTVVRVKADGREQEAVGIMFRNGANNANIPANLMNDFGSRLTDTGLTSDQMAKASNPIDTGDFFTEPIPPEAPGIPDVPVEPTIPEVPGSPEADHTLNDPDLRLS